MSDKIIIVADDSLLVTKFINKAVLNKFLVLEAKDGNEVIGLIKNNQDKTIIGMLLDLNMPNYSGFEVLEYFKENDLFKKIPVSIITGDNSSFSINKVFEYPIVDVLNKPFNENDIYKTINKIILHKTSQI